MPQQQLNKSLQMINGHWTATSFQFPKIWWRASGQQVNANCNTLRGYRDFQLSFGGLLYSITKSMGYKYILHHMRMFL